jgi:tripartite ATP-independent transporter DctM subunit
MVTLAIFAALVVLMALNVPIAIATAWAAIVGFALIEDLPLTVVVQRMFTGINSFTLLAIPLFILTGRLMALGGITNDLIQLSRSMVGFMRGGLAYINIVASMFFAGITGSATADTSSVGSILIPAMEQKGYEKDFSVAVTATSSTIGIMIPPSIPMVIYGVISGTSIGKLFLGGVIPGLLVGMVLMAITAVLARHRGYPVEAAFDARETAKNFVKSIPPLTTVLIILGGIIFGVFTATEAAGVAALYSFLLGTLYYRELKLRQLPGIMLEVATITSMVALMIATASALAWLLASQQVPQAMGDYLLSLTGNPYLILLLFNLLLLFVGTWLDLSPALIIFTPILLPIAVELGVDPVHFGVIMVVNLAIGLFTPPVGVCLFVACGIAGISITDSIRALIPFFFGLVAVLLIVTYVPPAVMLIPNALMP